LKKKNIAVISTTFNRAPQLYRHLWTINSQDFPHSDFWVIIVDDGSVDETQEVIAAAAENFPTLSIINIRTDRKPPDSFGGQGIAYNVGLRCAEDLGVEYVILTGGDMLITSCAMRKHMEVQTDVRRRAWTISSKDKTKETEYRLMVDQISDVPDILLGSDLFYIRPDHQTLGNDQLLLSAVVGNLDWQPAENLLHQWSALTIEPIEGADHNHLGFTGDVVVSRTHPEWTTWQSCKLQYWLDIGGFDEAGTGHFWEEEQLERRFNLYNKYREELGLKSILAMTHESPLVCCFHQPHPRQLSNIDNREIFRKNVERYGFDVNKGQGIDWGRAKHEIISKREYTLR